METSKTIIQSLIDNGSLDYGSIIELDDFLSLFGVVQLDEARANNMEFDQIKENLKSDALKILSVVDTTRSILLKQGRYLQQQGKQLRVCLPSENIGRIESYHRAAQSKIRKANTLLKNSPREIVEASGNTAAKLMLQERSIQKKQLRH